MAMAGGTSGVTPTIGARVVTADGDELGKVKEVSGACFKVDAKMRPDYWRANDCIAGETGGELHLSLDEAHLSDAKMAGPEHYGVHKHDDTVV